jgi:hypothetical protein
MAWFAFSLVGVKAIMLPQFAVVKSGALMLGSPS